MRALHERTEGVPLFVASMVSDVAARSAQSGVGTAELLATRRFRRTFSRSSSTTRASSGTSGGRCFRRPPCAAWSFAWTPCRECSNATPSRSRRSASGSCGSSSGSPLRAPGTKIDAHEERYSFRHALFRQVLYDRMGSSARAELHRKVGTVLERERAEGRTVSAAQLATHFDLGRSPMEALRYYAEAAEAALMHLGPGECMSLTERGLSLVSRAPADARRTSLEIALATLRGVAAFHMLGVGDEATEGLHARALAAHRCSAASDAGPAAARGRTAVEPARRVRRGPCDGRFGGRSRSRRRAIRCSSSPRARLAGRRT